MACHWPAWSSTARCSRTSQSATPTPSDVSPRSPARRRLPEHRQSTQTASRAPLLKEEGAFFVPPLPHRHHHSHDPHHLPPEPPPEVASPASQPPRARALRHVRG